MDAVITVEVVEDHETLYRQGLRAEVISAVLILAEETVLFVFGERKGDTGGHVELLVGDKPEEQQEPRLSSVAEIDVHHRNIILITQEIAQDEAIICLIHGGDLEQRCLGFKRSFEDRPLGVSVPALLVRVLLDGGLAILAIFVEQEFEMNGHIGLEVIEYVFSIMLETEQLRRVQNRLPIRIFSENLVMQLLTDISISLVLLTSIHRGDSIRSEEMIVAIAIS